MSTENKKQFVRAPEGSMICQVVAVGTRKCQPVVGECDSWKTLGVTMVRIIEQDGEDMPFLETRPLCKLHVHAYVDEVLFGKNVWLDAREDLTNE